MTATDDLAFIRQIMERSRRVTVLGGHYFIVWGLLVALGLATNWLLIEQRLITRVNSGLLWAFVILIGYAYTFWAQRDDRKVEGAESRDGYLIGMVWLAFGAGALAILTGSLILGALPGRTLPGIYAVLTGTAFFLHGTMAGIGWLRNVGILWWLAALPLFTASGPDTMLVYAGLLLVLQVVPGIILAIERKHLLAANTGVTD